MIYANSLTKNEAVINADYKYVDCGISSQEKQNARNRMAKAKAPTMAVYGYNGRDYYLKMAAT